MKETLIGVMIIAYFFFVVKSKSINLNDFKNAGLIYLKILGIEFMALMVIIITVAFWGGIFGAVAKTINALL